MLMLSVVMLNVVTIKSTMMSAIMLIVVAPKIRLDGALLPMVGYLLSLIKNKDFINQSKLAF
jgi:hypothetical protein